MLEKMKTSEELLKYDVLICGGGIAGLVSAFGLAKNGKSILLIERANKIGLNGADVLKPSGIKIIEELGLMDEVIKREAQKRSKVKFFHGGNALATMDYSENNDIPYFYLAPYGVIASVLLEQLLTFDNVEIRYETSVTSLIRTTKNVVAKLSDLTFVSADLIVGADGGNSIFRKEFLPDTEIYKYDQKMFFGCFESVESVKDINRLYTDEHFGLAYFYPINNHQFRAVLGFKNEEDVAFFKENNLSGLKKRLSAFVTESDDALNAIDAIEGFVSFPLCKMTVDKMNFKNCVLIGNSAHQINPITGQGMNLAIEDAHELILQMERYYTGEVSLDQALEKYSSIRTEVCKKVVAYGHNLATNYQSKEAFANALNLKLQTSSRKEEDLQSI